MHEKINANIQLCYSDDYDELLNTNIKKGKELSEHQVEACVVQYLANTNFADHMLHDFEWEGNSDTIKDWLRVCRESYDKLTVTSPISDEDLYIGTFKSDHKYTQYAQLIITYERHYLENE